MKSAKTPEKPETEEKRGAKKPFKAKKEGGVGKDKGVKQDSTQNKGAFKKGEKRPSQGRPKGCTNKVTKALKEMILGALDDAGGQKYLVSQSRENPTAFLTLVGKVLPLTLSGPDGGPVQFERIERVIVDPKQ